MSALVSATAEDVALLPGWLAGREDAVTFAGPVGFPLDVDALMAEHPSFALRREGVCVGFGQVWATDDTTARIGRILVDPSRRGEGLGRVLVSGLVAAAKENFPGATAVTLGVYEQNEAARRLYTSLGFVEQPERTTTQVAGQVWSAVLMRRPL